MPTLNIDARDHMAAAAGSLCGSGSLILRNGATVLATHTMAGFTDTGDGVQTANAIANATPVASGLVNTAVIVNGTKQVTLTVGAGMELVMDDYNLVAGGVSKVLSVTITYPA